MERLISHFVASKKSLVTISDVQRAKDIVAIARSSLENIASLKARNLFCRKGIDRQVRMLSALQGTLRNVLDEGEAEFMVSQDQFPNLGVSLILSNSRLSSKISMRQIHESKGRSKC